MSDDTDSLHHLRTAIERLDPDARESLKHWLYLNSWEESTDRVAEAVPKYETNHLSIEEYLEHEAQSPTRYEYVDGQIFAMSGARMRHSIICGNVFLAMATHLRGSPCMAFKESFKVALRTRERSFMYYPDVMVACGKKDPQSVYLEDPKLVIEVLSPSTARVDRNEKARNYRRIPTLQEYVLIAQSPCQVVIQRREEEWRSRTLDSVDQTLRLESIAMSLRLADIYEGALK